MSGSDALDAGAVEATKVSLEEHAEPGSDEDNDNDWFYIALVRYLVREIGLAEYEERYCEVV